MGSNWEPPDRPVPAPYGPEAETARPVRLPPSATAAPADPVTWWMRRHLDRLAAALRHAGWSSTLRYDESCPLLRVFAAPVPDVTECVTVARGPGEVWWFWSSQGQEIAPCADAAGAAWEIAVLLTPRVAAALTPRDGAP